MRPQKSLTKDVTFNAAGGLLLMVGQLVAVPIGLSVAGVERYGAWAAIFAIVQFLALFDLGIAVATLRQLAASGSSGSRTLHGTLLTSFLCMLSLGIISALGFELIMFFLGHTLTDGYLDSSQYALICVEGGLALPLALVGRHFQACNQGARRFDSERVHQVVAAILRILLLLLALYFSLSIDAVIATELTCLVLPGLLSLCRIRHTAPVYNWARPVSIRSDTSSLLSYGIPWYTSAALTQAFNVLPPAAVGLGGTAVLTAGCAAANRVIQALRSVNSWILDPVVPAISADPSSAHRRQESVTRIMAVVGLVIVVPSCVLAFAGMETWLGPGMVAHTAAIIYVGFAVSGLIASIHFSWGVIQGAAGKPAYYLLPSAILTMSTLVGLALAAPSGPVAVSTVSISISLLCEWLFLLPLRRELSIVQRRRLKLMWRSVSLIAVIAVALGVGTLALCGNLNADRPAQLVVTYFAMLAIAASGISLLARTPAYIVSSELLRIRPSSRSLP